MKLYVLYICNLYNALRLRGFNERKLFPILFPLHWMAIKTTMMKIAYSKALVALARITEWSIIIPFLSPGSSLENPTTKTTAQEIRLQTPFYAFARSSLCVWERVWAHAFHQRVCVLERRECGWESAKMPSSEGLIHFALFSALFHLLDGHTSLAPHPPEKKGPSVPASFVMGVWALLKLLAFHLSHSFCLSAKAFSTLFTRWYTVWKSVARVRLSRPRRSLTSKPALEPILPRPHFAVRATHPPHLCSAASRWKVPYARQSPAAAVPRSRAPWNQGMPNLAWLFLQTSARAWVHIDSA
jgi:hypothetical protein